MPQLIDIGAPPAGDRRGHLAAHREGRSRLAALRPSASTEPEGAVEEVYALVDGLTLHAVLRPGRPAPETMRRILRTHLEPMST